MIERVVSGFQSGSDMGGILAAVDAKLPTSGWMPRGFKTERGPRPEYAELYGAREHESGDYPPRTRFNVRDSHATLWFGSVASSGGRCTRGACRDLGKPVLVIEMGSGITPVAAADWIEAKRVRCLNIAGNRESSAPGIEAKVRRFMASVFRILADRAKAIETEF